MHFKHTFFWAALCAAFSLEAATIDPKTPAGWVAIDRKIHCSLKDQKPVYYIWKGTAWSRVQGERDRKLFNVEGMNVRQCITVQDDQKGIGWSMVSREIMLYLDPKSSKVLRRWKNPWTGERVKVIHVANDPVNSRAPTFALSDSGRLKPSQVSIKGDKFFVDIVVPLFYPNPLGGEYQPYVGNYYHSAEIFNFSGQTDELLDDDLDSISPSVSWVRIAPWLPWMEMAGREGMMYFSATGYKLLGWDEMPQVLKKEIAKNYPAYREPPPTDDQRRNQTSWTFFKQALDERAARLKTDR